MMKSQEAIRNKLRTAFLVHAEGHIRKHLANVEVLLSNPAGIGEHGDIVGEIEKELKEVAHYEDLVDAMKKYFPEVDPLFDFNSSINSEYWVGDVITVTSLKFLAAALTIVGPPISIFSIILLWMFVLFKIFSNG